MALSDKQIKIMEQAERLFSDRGFNGTSVRDIAEAANVNLAMISYYFGSKEKLMEEIFRYRTESFTEQLTQLLDDSSLDPSQKVERMIDEYVNRIFQRQCFHRIMIREQIGSQHPEIAQRIYELKHKNLVLVKKILDEGKEQGMFLADADPEMLMVTLTGTTNQMVSTQKFYQVLNNKEQMSEDDFQAEIKEKLSKHLKKVFKLILKYDE